MSSRKISVGSLARSSASIVDDIVRHLERLIVTGALAAGEKIPSERSLSVELGVSRPVLREALSRLEAAGLVTRRHGSGTRVTGGLPLADSLAQRLERGSDEFEHSAEFREVVEPEIARLAAARISDEQLGALRELGCRAIQGYLLGRPAPADQATAHLQRAVDAAQRSNR